MLDGFEDDKISFPHWGSKPENAQPVTSCFTDYAVLACQFEQQERKGKLPHCASAQSDRWCKRHTSHTETSFTRFCQTESASFLCMTMTLCWQTMHPTVGVTAEEWAHILLAFDLMMPCFLQIFYLLLSTATVLTSSNIYYHKNAQHRFCSLVSTKNEVGKDPPPIPAILRICWHILYKRPNQLPLSTMVLCQFTLIMLQNFCSFSSLWPLEGYLEHSESLTKVSPCLNQEKQSKVCVLWMVLLPKAILLSISCIYGSVFPARM